VNSLVDQIKNNNPDLKSAEISGLLYILKNNNSITNQELITLTGIPKETLRQFKKSIAGLLEEKSGDRVSISGEGMSVLEKLDVFPYNWSLLGNMSQPNFPSNENTSDEILNKIKIVRDRYLVDPKREYDQFLATSDTVFNKGKVVNDKGLIEGKSIALIGDDDLNSLSLGLINSRYRKIVVFDIDPNILDLVKKASVELGLKNIETVFCDVRKDIDKKFLGKFDVVVFDPPYTKSGVTLFLERAVELLGNTESFEGKYIFMYYGNSFKSPEKTLKVQEIINRFGLSIEDRIDKFARYTGADSIGNASSLYILKAGKFTHTLGFKVSRIYTFENQKEEKFPFVDHLVFKIFGVKKEFTLSKNKLVNTLDKICNLHKLKVVDRKVVVFKGGGMTATFVLSNSNLVVHTWPEFGSVHLDLITCSPIYKKESMIDTIAKAFETDTIEVSYVE